MLNLFFSLRCPDCGKKINEGDSLCPHCGIDIESPLGEIERHTITQQYLEKAQKDYERGKNIKRALSDVKRAVQFEPESAEIHNLQGLILDAMGKIDDGFIFTQLGNDK